MIYFSSLVSSREKQEKNFKVGFLIRKKEEKSQSDFINWSVERLNNDNNNQQDSRSIIKLIRSIEEENSFDAQLKTLELLEDGATILINLLNDSSVAHVESICSQSNVTHLNLNSNDEPKRATRTRTRTTSEFNLNFLAPKSIQLKAIIEFLLNGPIKFESSALIVNHFDTIRLIDEILNEKRIRIQDIRMQIMYLNSAEPNEIRNLFKYLSSLKIKLIALDILCENIPFIFKYSQQVSMLTDRQFYILNCIHFASIKSANELKYSGAQIFWFNQINITELERLGLPSWTKLESALLWDSLRSISRNSRELFDLSYNFREGFYRSNNKINYYFDINQLTDYGSSLNKIGNWTLEGGIKLDANETKQLKRIEDPLIVSAVISAPFFMIKPESKYKSGNSRYEGYAIDLLDQLARMLGFEYELKESDDGSYGVYDYRTRKWNGLINEIITGRADLAIGDLSITSKREDVVDFTLPFMSTGISILYRKQISKRMRLLSFFAPFKLQVWLYFCLIFILVSMALTLIGRLSPYEWRREINDEENKQERAPLECNQFSITNSLWFVTGAVMQQGSEIAPKSLSARLLAAFWYIFAIIIVSSYTANLAAFLTVELVEHPFERAEDLYKNKQGIVYGCLESGSTCAFFEQFKQKHVFRKMSKKMIRVKTLSEGIERSSSGNKFAFFLESTRVEYEIERNCNLTKIGPMLDSKAYGIALIKNTANKRRLRGYRTRLNEAILGLQENGYLDRLKSRWWQDERDGGRCSNQGHLARNNIAKELTLDDLQGIFLVLVIGILVSFIICSLEIYFKSCKIAATKGTTRMLEVKRIIRFAFYIKSK